jgi:hypothetical protein
VKIGKRARRLIQEAAVLGYVNGVWSVAGSDAEIPPDIAVAAEVIRAARAHPDLYPTLSRVELPDDDPITAWLDTRQAEHLAVLRALLDERLS